MSITLRIVLVENLARLAQQITQGRAARQTADGIADRLLRAQTRAALRRLPRSARASPARPGSDHHAGAEMARPAPRGPEHDDRNGRARRPPSAGRLECHHTQYRHQTARDLRPRLAAVVQTTQSRRRCFRRRRSIRDDGLPHARALPKRGCGAGAQLEARRTRYRPRCGARRKRSAEQTIEQARRSDPGYHLLAGGRRAFEATLTCRPPRRIRAPAPPPVRRATPPAKPASRRTLRPARRRLRREAPCWRTANQGACRHR